MLSASRFIFVLFAAYVPQGRLDLILFVHFGAVSGNPALKERIPGCDFKCERCFRVRSVEVTLPR